MDMDVMSADGRAALEAAAREHHGAIVEAFQGAHAVALVMPSHRDASKLSRLLNVEIGKPGSVDTCEAPTALEEASQDRRGISHIDAIGYVFDDSNVRGALFVFAEGFAGVFACYQFPDDWRCFLIELGPYALKARSHLRVVK